MLDSLDELTQTFSRDFCHKQSLLLKRQKEYLFEDKIKSQIEFSMRMLLEKQNHSMARANSAILEMQNDLEETTQIVKNSMVQLDERENMLMEVELKYTLFFIIFKV